MMKNQDNLTKEELLINGIQHFSVGDGPGIRTTVFFHGCNLHCPWCHNPETWNECAKGSLVPVIKSSSELMDEILKDKEFYIQSKGGVTLSGGEVMLHSNDILPLLRKLNKENISVYIDTAGDVPYNNFNNINNHVQGYLFDIKHSDEIKLKEIIGMDFARVKNNLDRLLETDSDVRIRIPLIPGFNTSPDDIMQISDFLHSKKITRVELIPFHRLGLGKYAALGIEYPYKNITLSRQETDSISALYKRNFDVYVE